MKETIQFTNFFSFIREEISALFHCPTEEIVNSAGVYMLCIHSAYGDINLCMEDIVNQYVRFVRDNAEDSLATIIKVVAWLMHQKYMEE